MKIHPDICMSTYFERFLVGCFRINFQVFLNPVLERIACCNLNLKKQVRTTRLRTARVFFLKKSFKKKRKKRQAKQDNENSKVRIFGQNHVDVK